ncbi:MAG: hypothetical protein Q9211_006152 [Gyalolechia sp. 1 TL-2023]
MESSVNNRSLKDFEPHRNGGGDFSPSFKNPFAKYVGKQGNLGVNFTIVEDGNQPNSSRKPGVSTPVSSPTSSSSKRGSAFINLVSSDEDDDIADVTPKKAKRNIIESSSSPEPHPKHHTQGKATSRSSINTVPSHPTKPQAFDRVEIPSKESASIVPATPRAVTERARFLGNLSQLRGPRVTVVNNIDESSPSIEFRFVNESVLGPGVSRAPDEVMIGCDCKKHYGPNPGCQYLKCECLIDSALNASGSRVFPYSSAQRDAGRLRDFYLESRHHIYECNANCNCDYGCKNRNVQFGRQVPLEIFKTPNRGWGLRCLFDLQKGEFIDTYRGEIITVEEANARGMSRSADEGNYFMNFDKFTEPEAVTKSDFLEFFPDKERWHAEKVQKGDWVPYRKDGKEMWLNPEYIPYLYVCDGMHVGGPTRFMNHSCDPNCRLFTVSYNHSDENIYDLAFFTMEAIPAGSELTFDYKDEDDRSIITHEQALEVQRRDGYMPQKCRCGTTGCRQYFFN